VKPPPFDYVRPETIEEVLAVLAEEGGDAKILAGGQSLMPLLNFRMLRPAMLIDINHVRELAGVAEQNGALRVGALTRHHRLETSPVVQERFPVLSAAMAHVAHLAIRNRGTIGGSLSHADPAAELPMMALLLDAELHVRSRRGDRAIPARDFFVGPLTTVLEDDELVTQVLLPDLPPGCAWGFEEFSQRMGDFAIVAVAALVKLDDGKISELRLALMGVDETPVRLREIEKDVVGEMLSPALAASISQLASEAVKPPTDLKASSEYRGHLVRALTKRILNQAAGRLDVKAA
jgi:carbon-monoxide dehydrogenase medium subunit